MGNAFQCVLNWMSIVVQRVDAPFIALSVMMSANDAVDCRVTHVHVWRSHVDFRTESFAAVSELAVFHALEQIQVLFNRTIAVWGFLTRLGQSTSVSSHFISSQIINICFSFFDQMQSILIAFIKVVGTVEDTAGWFCTQPDQVFFNGFYIFVVLTNRVGIVKTQIEQTAVFLSGAGVDPDCFRTANVQVAVWFWREAGMDLLDMTFLQIFVNDVVNKIGIGFFHCHCLSRPFFLGFSFLGMEV